MSTLFLLRLLEIAHDTSFWQYQGNASFETPSTLLRAIEGGVEIRGSKPWFYGPFCWQRLLPTQLLWMRTIKTLVIRECGTMLDVRSVPADSAENLTMCLKAKS